MRQQIYSIQNSGQYLRLLIQRQAELLRELKAKREGIAELREPVPADDQPGVAQESSIAEELSAIESSELSRINEALARLRDGAYGMCEQCGSAISSSRLMAIPWAERCHRCEAHRTSSELAEIGRAY